VRHLRAQGRKIPVLFFRNSGGSVSGRVLLGRDDKPILDGPSPDAVLALAEDLLDGLLFARSLRAST
jgi:hypothetical protein